MSMARDVIVGVLLGERILRSRVWGVAFRVIVGPLVLSPEHSTLAP
jgi:hypothetical protein